MNGSEQGWTRPGEWWRLLPGPLRLAVWVIAVQVAVATLFRGVFWLLFRSTAGEVPALHWATAWYLGFKFDLRLALWVALPLALLGWLRPLDPRRSKAAWRGWATYLTLAQMLVVVVCFIDLGFYGYLQARLDAGVLDLLASPAIALQMVWETYPVLPGLALLGLLATGYALLLGRAAHRAGARYGPGAAVAAGDARPAASGWRRRAAVAGFALLVALGIYGKWSFYPLRWSDAFFGTDPFVSALALNPVLFLVDSYPDRPEPLDQEALAVHFGRVRELLALDDPAAGARPPLSLARFVPAPPSPAAGRRPANLVIIHLESLGTYKTGAFGNPLGATPHFDAMASQAYLFTRFFVPSGPTARSVFTMLTGIPDLNPVRSASRNPRAVSQHTLVSALDGHHKLYFLGGSASWGNIRGLLANNLAGLEIFEEGSYEADRADVWGLTDLDLFEAAHAELARKKRPFFAFIQTAGNHRPYTIPDDVDGFERVELPEERLVEHGFESLEAYNGLRFMDHALGRFFELARQAPYFENTLFALYGDHGGPTPRASGWNSLGLTTNQVPGVFWAPGLGDEGRRIDALASLVDLLPTSLGLMGIPYLDTTLGRDRLHPRPEDRPFALLTTGLLAEGLLLQVGPGGGSHLYRYESAEPTVEVSDELPEARQRMRENFDSLQAVARYLLLHNPPRPHEPAAVSPRAPAVGR